MQVKIVENLIDRETCLKLREIVFVAEQNVPLERDRDEFDDLAVHFLLTHNSTPIGTGRVVSKANTAIVERVAILQSSRGLGAGSFLMKNIIGYCKENGYEIVQLGSQDHAVLFYIKLGFEVCSDEYMDANIVHYKMQLIFNEESYCSFIL